MSRLTPQVATSPGAWTAKFKPIDGFSPGDVRVWVDTAGTQHIQIDHLTGRAKIEKTADSHLSQSAIRALIRSTHP